MATSTVDVVPDRVAEIKTLLQESGSPHFLVGDVLRTALKSGHWSVGAAQCLDMLRDPVSRRWSTDEELLNLQALWSLFNRLQLDSGQPPVMWDFGRWVTVDAKVPVMSGPWELVGWGPQG